MNVELPATVSELWYLAAWTMVHFLWLGAVAAVLAFLGRLALRPARPNIRYAYALLSLTLIAAIPLVTAAWLAATPSPFGRGQGEGALAMQPIAPEVASQPIIELHTPANDDVTSQPFASGASPNLPLETAAPSTLPTTPTSPTVPVAVRSATAGPTLAAMTAFVATLIPYLPWLWLIGTPLTFTLLVTGLIGVRRLHRASNLIDEGPLADALARLTTSLRITRRVTIAVCQRVAAPVLIGIVRPLILLPPAALTGWSPAEIEMVLLHELAHVRRYDNLVNLAQRIIESFLFFHPAVWIVSAWVRREREACCDAAVVARTQQPHAYATLLLNFASRLKPDPFGRSSTVAERGQGEGARLPLPPGEGRGEGALPFNPNLLAPLTSPMAHGPLRTRIHHILQLEDDPMLISAKSLALTIATLLTAATLAVLYIPKIGHAEPSTTQATENTESKNEDAKEKAEAPPTEAKQPAAEQPKSAPTGLPHSTGDWGSRKWSNSDKPSPTVATEGNLSSKFPSLEDQKLADLAFKRLGLELEPLDSEDLQRAKALGYDGGVKVVGGQSHAALFQMNDILVGLHAWPTTTMQEVVEILRRDDLAELNPLKFYVVRKATVPSADGQTPGEVLSGRITVQLPSLSGANRDRGGRPPSVSATTGQPVPAASADRYGSPPKIRENPTLASPQLMAQPPAFAPSEPSTSVPPTPKSLAPRASQLAPHTALRYDGKTFADWNTAWRTELSTEKRVEAVKALAAFGNAGYGKEAAEAIVAVAAEYDWYQGGGNAALNQLKTACTDAFGDVNNTLPNKLPAEDAINVLIHAADSKRWAERQFAATALRAYARTNTPAMEALCQLSRSEDEAVRAIAWDSLVRSYSPHSPAALKRVREALTATDAGAQVQALRALWMNDRRQASSGSDAKGLSGFAEVDPLLFSPDAAVRREARVVLRCFSQDEATRLVPQLLSVLNDESRKADHVAAIRALAALGKRATPSGDLLEKILVDNRDNLRIPAAAALKSILGDVEFNKLLGRTIADELKIRVDGGTIRIMTTGSESPYHEFNAAMEKEKKTVGL